MDKASLSGAGPGPNRNEKWSVVGIQSQRVAEHEPAGNGERC